MASRSLTQEERRALWTRYQPAASARASAGSGRPRRRPPRAAYDTATVAVRITHPGGGCRTAAVYAHDLSTGGLSFLYPGFLHLGTAVSVALPRRAGGEAVAHGFVAWCRHVGGLWHGVGVGFATPVATAEFLDPAEPRPVLAPGVAVPAVPEPEVKPDPPVGRPRDGGLVGRVLYLEPSELDQGLFLHTVRRTRLAVTTADDAAASMSAVAAGAFDVVCLDLNLGPRQPTGERVMAEMRAVGYAGPFVIVSGLEPSRLDRARAAAAEGAVAQSRVVAKPYAAPELLAELASALAGDPADESPMPPATATADAQPIASHLAGQDGMAPLLHGFCDRARAAASDLDRLLAPLSQQTRSGVSDARPVVVVRQLCQMLRGAGRGYGYPDVSAAADAALVALEEGLNGLESAADELRALRSVCRRVVA